jgi:hypothetical protein
MEPFMSAQPLNADSQLEYTQNIRRRLVDALLPPGAENPEALSDPKVANVLLSALKDHDKVTLTLKRLDADNENADSDRAVLERFHKLSNMAGSKDLLRTEHPTGEAEGPRFNPAEIPVVDLVDGETRTGADPIDYDQFMQVEGDKHRQSLA